MTIDRRRVLALAGAALASGLVRPTWGNEVDEPIIDRLHPLTRSLLDRARRIDRSRSADKEAIERTIRQYADETGWTGPFVIEWIETPTDVHEYLASLGLDALLNMATANFWRRCVPPITHDENIFDRCFEAQAEAGHLLRVREFEHMLMAPKLEAKSMALSNKLPIEAIFKVRAISAQVGWLETSMATEAARAISNVETLLSTEASADTMAIHHYLRVFEAHEHGLLATWETAGALICAVRSRFRIEVTSPEVSDQLWSRRSGS